MGTQLKAIWSPPNFKNGLSATSTRPWSQKSRPKNPICPLQVRNASAPLGQMWESGFWAVGETNSFSQWRNNWWVMSLFSKSERILGSKCVPRLSGHPQVKPPVLWQRALSGAQVRSHINHDAATQIALTNMWLSQHPVSTLHGTHGLVVAGECAGLSLFTRSHRSLVQGILGVTENEFPSAPCTSC